MSNHSLAARIYHLIAQEASMMAKVTKKEWTECGFVLTECGSQKHAFKVCMEPVLQLWYHRSSACAPCEGHYRKTGKKQRSHWCGKCGHAGSCANHK